MGRRDVYTNTTGIHNVLHSFYTFPFHFKLRANLHPTTRFFRSPRETDLTDRSRESFTRKWGISLYSSIVFVFVSLRDTHGNI